MPTAAQKKPQAAASTNVPLKKLAPFIVAMITLVLASNILVNFPINEWLTYGAFSYPLSFLLSDLCNRLYGLRAARRVVAFGLIGMGFTFVLAYFNIWGVGYRVGVASVLAYVIGQGADVTVFNHFRKLSWWRAPLMAGLLASLLDSVVFYSIAFYGVMDNWVELSMGDFSVKLVTILLGLLPYRLILKKLIPNIK
ncbi:MAG: queuosine precursor transporter [Hydrotalea sp.]|nr:queuosine precursor transporter [Hydrotalea sp.]